MLVGEVGVQAGLHSNGTLLHKDMGHGACLASGVDQRVLHVENGLIEIFLSVCGSSTP